MKLYEIDQAINELIQNGIDLETGELTPKVEKELDALELIRDQKLENIGLYIKNLKAESEAIQAEEKILSGRRSSLNNKAEYLKRWLTDALEGETLKTPRLVIAYRKSKRVETTADFDLQNISPEFKKITIVLNKVSAGRYIKSGNKLPGVVVNEYKNIVIK